MRNKIGLVLLTAAMVFALSACQLAQENLLKESGDSKFIGVFISYEYLDLFDVESYLNDNLANVESGETITIEGNARGYDGKIYATLVQEERTATGGEKYTDSKFVFEGLEGLFIFSAEVTDPLTQQSYIFSDISEGLADVKNNYVYGDTEETSNRSATIYMTPNANILFINPVYQDSEGNVYLESGSGVSMEIGAGFSQSRTSSTSYTEDNITKTYTCTVDIRFELKNPSQNVVVYQMNGDNLILNRTEFSPEEVPEEITPDANCEYFLVENQYVDDEGVWQAERELFSKKDMTISFFKQGAHDVLLKAYASILWDTEAEF